MGINLFMLKEIGPSSSGIYSGQIISCRLSRLLMDAVTKLESHTPSSDERNSFTTYSINESAKVGGIRLTSILNSIYSRLTSEYLLATGTELSVPLFPNPSCTIKSQTAGQSHKVHTDGGDGDYGMGRILYSSAICLNDDYEGGHTQFYLTGTMENPNVDIDIKLKAGEALIFNADLNYHGITEVTSGSRFSLIQFWRE
jgi:hypothetical protein